MTVRPTRLMRTHRRLRRCILVAGPAVAVGLAVRGAWPEAGLAAACTLVPLLAKLPEEGRWW